MGFLKRLFGSKNPVTDQAKSVYANLMQQSRMPDFYGDGRFPDSYDGRIECLTVHLAVIMSALREKESELFTDAGKMRGKDSFSQVLFDVMVEDFDIALREEGLTDSGVKRRIKPMVAVFYARIMGISEHLGDKAALTTALSSGALKEASPKFLDSLSDYLVKFSQSALEKSYADLTLGQINYPAVS